MTDNNKSNGSILLDVPLIKEWLEEAGSIALSYFQRCGYRYKIDQTPVTEADKAVEQFLVEKIQKAFPKHGILAEEQTAIPGNEYTWVIDPIDGTSAFIMGIPTWCIAIGVLRNLEPFFGIVYVPVTGELYHAYPDKKAFWNGHEITMNENIIIDEKALLCLSTYSHRHHKILFPGRIYSIGSGILQHLLVARGLAAGSVTLQPKIWDLAAVFPIIKSAGGLIQYLSGDHVYCKDLFMGQVNDLPILTGHANTILKLTEMIQ